jgi:hypothetical protein
VAHVSPVPVDRDGMTTTLTARGPEDLLAAVPIVLGFRPADSVVMLTFDARRTFHARVDLPLVDALDADLPELTEALLAPCLMHGVGRVAFVVYSADARLSARVARRLRSDFRAREIGVIDVLRADQGRWCRVPSRSGAREECARPYDDATHPFAAQAVFDGQVTLASRDDLRETLAPDPEAQQIVRSRQRGLGAPGPAELGWVTEVLERCVLNHADPDDEEAARLLWAIGRIDVRDAALFAVTRETSREHLRIWSALVRKSPAEQVPAAAVLAAFAAWQAGQGALAWCALDRCFEIEPDHSLARGLAECLTRAVPPAAWGEVAELSGLESDTA